jgi:hypothetical protein
MNKEIKYKIDKNGTLWIRKFKNLIKQRCPHGEGDCGIYCPKFEFITHVGFCENNDDVFEICLCCGEKNHELTNGGGNILFQDLDVLIEFDLEKHDPDNTINKRKIDFNKLCQWEEDQRNKEIEEDLKNPEKFGEVIKKSKESKNFWDVTTEFVQVPKPSSGHIKIDEELIEKTIEEASNKKLTPEEYKDAFDRLMEINGKEIKEAIYDSLTEEAKEEQFIEDYKKVCANKNQQKFVNKKLTDISTKTDYKSWAKSMEEFVNENLDVFLSVNDEKD